jgi:hypothetical protein
VELTQYVDTYGSISRSHLEYMSILNYTNSSYICVSYSRTGVCSTIVSTGRNSNWLLY